MMKTEFRIYANDSGTLGRQDILGDEVWERAMDNNNRIAVRRQD